MSFSPLIIQKEHDQYIFPIVFQPLCSFNTFPFPFRFRLYVEGHNNPAIHGQMALTEAKGQQCQNVYFISDLLRQVELMSRGDHFVIEAPSF